MVDWAQSTSWLTNSLVIIIIILISFGENLSAALTITDGMRTLLESAQQWVSWCFEPSHPQRITSGLNTNYTLSPSYSFHKSSYHKSCFFCFCFFWGLFLFRGHSAREMPLVGWPILFCGPTQEPCVSHSQHRRNRERFLKKCRWMDRKLEISKEEIPGSKRSMFGYTLTYSML